MLVYIAVDVSGAIYYDVFIMLSPFLTLMVTAHQGPYSVELVSGEFVLPTDDWPTLE